MASTGKVILVSRNILANSKRHVLRNLSQRMYCSSALQVEPKNDNYPPVKPRYPPGTWDKYYKNYKDDPVEASQRCWEEYEKAQELLKHPNAKARLEAISGHYFHKYYQTQVTGADRYPMLGQYKQYLSKTKVIRGSLPEVLTKVECEEEYTAVRQYILDTIILEHELHSTPGTRRSQADEEELTTYIISSVLNRIFGQLAVKHDHLFQTQIDKDVRVETFWTRTGFEEDPEPEKKLKGIKNEDIEDMKPYRGLEEGGRIKFQYKGTAKFQVRSESPLPQFVDVNDDLCTDNSYHKVEYYPDVHGFDNIRERCITMSGHWIGDPCEFNLLSIYKYPLKLGKLFRKECAENVLPGEMDTYGMMSGFASCLSQAYNQGFTRQHEITYPFTTQSMLIDDTGKNVQFFAYQLNTIQLDKDDEANPYQNLCWASEPIPLYETVKDGKVEGFNDAAFKNMLRMFMVKPVDRGVDLRPYLPDDPSPSVDERLINNLGEEPIERPKIERWQYPRHSIYHN